MAAGRGVRSSVLRLPMYVWGNSGSYFIPLNIAAAKQHGKAHYMLPGWVSTIAAKYYTCLTLACTPCATWHTPIHICPSEV